jgi:hypothetical protein
MLFQAYRAQAQVDGNLLGRQYLEIAKRKNRYKRRDANGPREQAECRVAREGRSGRSEERWRENFKVDSAASYAA